ncbi:hypothetical protein B0H13DRAFT_250771 [Mycena leptocephala]|nr:hypothetical protein B0H13DRAFT_250771 [Mycena leptocephala]
MRPKAKRVFDSASRFLEKLWLYSRERVREFAARKKAESAPAYINSLPSELLVGEIFPLVIDSEGQTSWLENILVLARVCRYWKNLAHTPLLWNKQYIPINRGQFLGSRRRRKKLVNEYFKVIETWLARSAPLAVPVSLRSWNFRTLDEFERAVDMVFRVAARWKTLDISTWPSVDATTRVLRALAHLPDGTLQALTAVTLNLYFDVRPPKVLSVFMSAARLRRAELRVGPETADLMSMPLAQLTHITLNSTTPRACFAALAECTNAVSAVLNCDHTETVQDGHDSAALPMSMTTATLPHLVTLRVSVSPALIHLLGHLVLPSLKTLELYDHYKAWPFSETFRPFLLSAPTLRHLALHLNHARLSSADLCALLRCTPSLTTLDLGCIDVDNTVLDALRSDLPRSAVLLPQLETLSLGCDAGVGADFDEGSLLALIASRRKTDNAVRLKRMVCKGWGTFSQAFHEALDTYRAEGLDIEISRPPIARWSPLV